MNSDIRVVEHPMQLTAGMRATVPMDGLTAFFTEAFAKTMSALEAQGIQPSGPPFGKYYGTPGSMVDVEAGFPVSERISSLNGIEPGALPSGLVVEAVHTGSYDTLDRTYADVDRFCAAAGLTAGPLMWESYLSGPEFEPDPARWQTLICQPVVEREVDVS